MAYVQKNNPFPRTGCGRRRFSQMTPFSEDSPLNKKVKNLEKLQKVKVVTLEQ